MTEGGIDQQEARPWNIHMPGSLFIDSLKPPQGEQVKPPGCKHYKHGAHGTNGLAGANEYNEYQVLILEMKKRVQAKWQKKDTH